ncbi:HAD family phosphatase [Pseudomaricurvus alkylphenolicus]|uniref:HAD family hydrolase n=1 Tax=Pseudomaricurvus alkylphenolicus TaxID=1306991 RepID=UPI0014224A37|nr:HAD family phosphatase [Pseudomaricurvus alkylphenolicus]NIB42591.1 HAD family phosphatase [Pseudomaricurvus alkylphenolicus]
MIKGIIYDHDGTLINSEQMHYESWRDILVDYDVDFTLQEYIREHNGVPTIRNAEIIVETYGLAVEPTDLTHKKLSLARDRFAAQPSPLMPFAKETLQNSFDAGYALAIATGAGSREIDLTMEAYGLRHFFKTIATRDDVQNSKPAPDVYLLAQERLGLKPGECVAVEDTETGIKSAKNAGLYCIAVENDFSAGQDLGEADKLEKNLAEAFVHIRNLTMG